MGVPENKGIALTSQYNRTSIAIFGLPLLDLINEGTYGLIKAVE